MGHGVRITRFPPRWSLPHRLAGTLMILAPTWSEWNLAKTGSVERFVASYTARMETLGVTTIETALASMGLSGTLVLLCFESLAGIPPAAQKLVCHRRLWADWRTGQTGDPVPELGL